MRHDQYGVAGDRPVEPDLRLVEAEAILAELERLFAAWNTFSKVAVNLRVAVPDQKLDL